MSFRPLPSCHVILPLIAAGICFHLASAASILAGDLGDGDAKAITILLPTWSGSPQQLEVREPNHEATATIRAALTAAAKAAATAGDQATDESDPDPDVSTADDPAVILEKMTEAVTDPSPSPTDSQGEDEAKSALTSAHLLMPQKAPPMPSAARFSPLSPAADIWLQGLAWVVEGQEFEKAGELGQAIGRFQIARSAYELVERRFPDWQPDIIAFRLGNLERKIRLLVQKKQVSQAPGK